MLPTRRRSTFAGPPTAFERQLVPVAATMLASLLPIVPVVLDQPLLPPLGLVVFLGWRLMRADILPLWAGLPLGLFDDLLSGQPVGSAMAGWTAILLVLDALDRRLPFRSPSQNWAIASAAVAAQTLLGWLLARFGGGGGPLWLMVPGWLVAVLLWPLAARCCAALDRWRAAR